MNADDFEHRPPALDGLDPRWSRWVPVADVDSTVRTWHVLDSHVDPDGAPAARGGPDVVGTVLCVHGNPTWSYLWRRLVAAPPPGWRIVAVDQLGMGYSERPPGPRRLADRVDDLTRLTAALHIDGPVVTAAHDWGGPISLGWARDHRDQIAGLVLVNTAVHQPAGSPAPALIRLARTPGLRQLLCHWTPAFRWTTVALSRPALPKPVRQGLAAPYRHPGRRRAIADFVADIPLDARHPSADALESIVAALPGLADVPTLLLWGPRDPVFSDRYLRDLLSRLPQADVHRFQGASHLVLEDRPDAADVIGRWISGNVRSGRGGPQSVDADRPAVEVDAQRSPLLSGLTERRGDPSAAVIEAGGPTISFADLARRVDDIAEGLQTIGVRRGQRVGLLLPPGIDLTTAVYACWQLGAVIVVADAGLGLRRLGRALRGTGGDWVIGSARGLSAATMLRVPGQRISAGRVPRTTGHALAAVSLNDLARLGRDAGTVQATGPQPYEDDVECAVVFTSGATGPPKGVSYRVGAVRAQIALLRHTYRITDADRLVAAFAPFALYGPALGIASAVPAMDVTAPASLTAAALADAVAAVGASVVFASPAALRNVVATAADLTSAQRITLSRPRLVMSAGAPLPLPLLRAVAALIPNASIHTPYGMTEVLPVTDVSLEQLEEVGPGRGVCVGLPVTGTRLAISALDGDGRAVAAPDESTDITGEVCVRARHGKARYDRLWATEADSSRNEGWHRTGDVGHLDAAGRLWIEGRLSDVVLTANGPVTPVPLEQRIQSLPDVESAAVVGVGPIGAQQLVAVLVTAAGGGRRVRVARPNWAASLRAPRGLHLRLADLDLVDRVRDAAGAPLAAVLTTAALPVDIRHNSKINHPLIAEVVTDLLAGHQPRWLRRR